jgi:hypothetical protein
MQTTTWVIPSVSKYLSKIDFRHIKMIIIYFLTVIDKSTARFAPSVAKGRRHSAPAVGAKASTNNNDLSTKKEKKGNERKKDLETMSEPECK